MISSANLIIDYELGKVRTAPWVYPESGALYHPDEKEPVVLRNAGTSM